MKSENTKTNIEKEEDKRNESEPNDIKSRLRKNPNKTKSLYLDEYNDKKNKKKESQVVPPNEKEICRTILEILKKDEKSALFRLPAIRAFSEKKNKDLYKERIKEPRDLGNITKKLKSYKYKAKEFHEDVELCWSNAMSFNENHTEAYKNAEYMKDLCDKLYKEYGLFDIINKEKENKKNENETNNICNDISNDEKNEENNEKEKSNENNDKNNENSNNNNINNNKKSNENVNEIKKMVGRKRKRQTNNSNDDNCGDDIDIKNERKKETNNEENIKNNINNYINNKCSFFDIKQRFSIKHQIISSPDDINKLYKKVYKKKKRINRKNNISNLFKNNKLNNKSHNHHDSKQHFFRIKKMKHSLIQNEDIIFNNIKRKISYEWKEFMYFNKSSFYYLNQKDTKNEEINNNNLNEKICQKQEINFISKFTINLNKDNKKENEEMGNYDNNCNSKNVYDLEGINERKVKYSLRQNMEFIKNNINKNLYDIYYNKERYEKKKDNNLNKKNENEKNYKLRNEIAKYFDKLSDNNMIELLVFIENIRPQSIKELANDTIYINMELFNEDTFSQVLEFVKHYI